MKRIMLHVVALVALAPCMLIFSEGSLWVNFFGMLYMSYLVVLLTNSEKARRFLRRYYHEILRLENGL